MEVEVTRIVEGEVVTEVIVVTATPVSEEPATEGEPVAGGTFYYGNSAIVQFDCPFINDDPSFGVSLLVNTFLFRTIRTHEGTATWKAIPELAKSW